MSTAVVTSRRWPRRVRPYEYPYTIYQLHAAMDSWGLNCGPGALAAMLGIDDLDVVAVHIPHFRERHYTNPSMMQAALRSLKVKWHEVDDSEDSAALDSGGNPMLKWPEYGLMRIQWEGPWLEPGVPPAAAYKHTHWIGCITGSEGFPGSMIFDFNTGWETPESWEAGVVKDITGQTKRATGGWHPTHRWELELPTPPAVSGECLPVAKG